MDFFDIIAVIGLVQALVVALLIFTNHIFHNKVNSYFAWFLVILAVIGLDARFKYHYEALGDFWSVFFDIVGDDIPWVMIVYLPLFKFFITATGKQSFKTSLWLFTIPFFLFTLINAIIDLDVEFNLIASPFFVRNSMLFYLLEDVISILLFISLHLLAFYRFIKPSENKWVRKLWWYTSFLILVWIILTLDQFLFEDNLFRGIEIFFWTSITVFVYWLMYSGLFQFNLANNRKEIRGKLIDSDRKITREKTAISKKSVTYYHQLTALMEEEKAYRNPDLGREQVADRLGISVSYLTQLIKEYTDKNLTAYVNEFRVEEVKKMLDDIDKDGNFIERTLEKEEEIKVVYHYRDKDTDD